MNKLFLFSALGIGLTFAAISGAASLNLENIEVSTDAPTKQEIEASVKNITDKNPSVTAATVSEESISVDYAAPAKLFGLFKTTLKINVSTHEDGRVKVKFPWYRFLFTTEFTHIAEEMNAVFQHNQSDLELLKNQDPLAAKMQVLVTITDTLKAKHDLSVGAGATTDTK